eukprot:Hpha_TRINITY_DN15442_c1_g1::TRINITY_DN15442_c1_g1_i1::g.173018::m.173018
MQSQRPYLRAHLTSATGFPTNFRVWVLAWLFTHNVKKEEPQNGTKTPPNSSRHGRHVLWRGKNVIVSLDAVDNGEGAGKTGKVSGSLQVSPGNPSKRLRAVVVIHRKCSGPGVGGGAGAWGGILGRSALRSISMSPLGDSDLYLPTLVMQRPRFGDPFGDCLPPLAVRRGGWGPSGGLGRGRVGFCVSDPPLPTDDDACCNGFKPSPTGVLPSIPGVDPPSGVSSCLGPSCVGVFKGVAPGGPRRRFWRFRRELCCVGGGGRGDLRSSVGESTSSSCHVAGLVSNRSTPSSEAGVSNSGVVGDFCPATDFWGGIGGSFEEVKEAPGGRFSKEKEVPRSDGNFRRPAGCLIVLLVGL